MSDEPLTPPLRLRLRPRNDQAAAGTPVVPPPAVEPLAPVASTEAAPRLRLKPRLTAEADTPEPAASSASPAPATPPPASTAQPAEPSRLKLRPRPAADAPATAGPALPPEPGKTGEIPALTPLPVLKMAPPESPSPAKADVPAAAVIAAAPPPVRPPARRSGRIVGGVTLLLLIAGGYCAYRIFPPASPTAAVVPGEVPIAKKTSAHPPAAVAGARQKSSLAAPAPEAPASSEEAKTVVHVEAASPAPAGLPPAPGVEFLAWVDAVKISGVVNGTPPRAIVNGLLVSPGDAVDTVRGIVFDHLDTAGKRFFFRDRSGAVAGRAY